MIKENDYSFLQMTKSHLVQSSLSSKGYFTTVSAFLSMYFLLKSKDYIVGKLVCRNYHQQFKKLVSFEIMLNFFKGKSVCLFLQ